MEYQGMMGKRSKELAMLMFVLGIIGAMGLRLVTIFAGFSQTLSKAVWYLALLVYIIFYGYRIIIEEKRRNIIVKHKLREKILSPGLEYEDRQRIVRVLDSVMVSRLGENFRIMLWLTVAAIIVQIVIDII
jgi:hypothetical protein